MHLARTLRCQGVCLTLLFSVALRSALTLAANPERVQALGDMSKRDSSSETKSPRRFNGTAVLIAAGALVHRRFLPTTGFDALSYSVRSSAGWPAEFF